MDRFQGNSVTPIRKVLLFFGFLPTQSYRERLSRHYIISFLLAYGTVVQICQFFSLDFDLKAIAIIMQLFVPCVCFSSLYFTAVVHFLTLQKLFVYVREDWQRLRDDVELKIMEKYAYETKMFTMIITASLTCFTILIIAPAFLRKILSTNNEISNSNYNFPMASCLDYILSRDEYYYTVLMQQVVIFLLIDAVAICIYSLYFGFIQHACARLSIVKKRIQQPFNNNDHNDNVVEVPIDLSDWMIDIVRHLARTTKFMKLVNKASERLYLFQMAVGFLFVIIDIVWLFQLPVLLKDEKGKKDAIVCTIYIIGTIFPIYVNCYIGQRLMDYSLDVCKEASLIPIHEVSLKTQKLLLTMLTISAKPCAISIGKIFVSSHEFFQCLLRSAFSFAMVLHSTQKV